MPSVKCFVVRSAQHDLNRDPAKVLDDPLAEAVWIGLVQLLKAEDKSALTELTVTPADTFLDEEPLIPCITVSLVADIYGRTTDEVMNDLSTYIERIYSL